MGHQRLPQTSHCYQTHDTKHIGPAMDADIAKLRYLRDALSLVHCTVLYCTAQYITLYTVLYCIVQYITPCNVQYCIAQYITLCTVLYCIAQYITPCAVLYCIAQYSTACTVLCCPAHHRMAITGWEPCYFTLTRYSHVSV